MKVRYVGETFFNGDGLTEGAVYTCLGVEGPFLRIIDGSGEDYLYCAKRPGPINPSEGRGGRFEIVEDDEKGSLKKAIAGTILF